MKEDRIGFSSSPSVVSVVNFVFNRVVVELSLSLLREVIISRRGGGGFFEFIVVVVVVACLAAEVNLISFFSSA